MKILAVDIGTGTQDIFLLNTQQDIENGFKMVLPSPTMTIFRKIKEATRLQLPIVLTGVTMGGGPSGWAVEEHARLGLPTYATPDASRTLNDDLNAVIAGGITIVSEDEVNSLPDSIERIELRDFDFPLIEKTFTSFGVNLSNLAAVVVAVFDHGAAPPDVSDRKFRFDYLDDRIRSENRLSAFAYRSGEIPSSLTRFQAVANSAKDLSTPLVVMDTAPAAVLGATFDPIVHTLEHPIIANVGNFHTLAFRLGRGGIEGVFEHHTGLVNQGKLENLLKGLANGTIQRSEVFDDNGHGALVYNTDAVSLEEGISSLIVTGPRRGMMVGSALKPHFAVPFGDMMIAGCFGLLSALCDVYPEFAEPIQTVMLPGKTIGIAPWDTD